MPKYKLRRFAENKTFENVVEPALEEVLNADYRLKGLWKSEFFKNSNPLILELGCGRGEYTIALADRDKNTNFIGIDIKGARIWRGAKTAIEKDYKNAGFLRTRIEFIESFFGKDEVCEIWITFPDPQLKSKRTKKRLTSPAFLSKYQKFITPNGIIHLKTDSKELYDYTMEVLMEIKATIHFNSEDIYSLPDLDSILEVKTYYENQFLLEDKKITYIKFSLPENPF